MLLEHTTVSTSISISKTAPYSVLLEGTCSGTTSRTGGHPPLQKTESVTHSHMHRLRSKSRLAVTPHEPGYHPNRFCFNLLKTVALHNQLTVNQGKPTQKPYKNIQGISFPNLSILWLINHEPIYIKLYRPPLLEMFRFQKKKKRRYEVLSHQLISLRKIVCFGSTSSEAHI